ncbi:MAG: TetR/AcrR family transcriptional regulator [Pseudomonadota bacterium]
MVQTVGHKRREMNPEGKRNAIMEVGERLFATHGYTKTSIGDIAKAANVAVGSVYRLFPDKPSLLAALHDRMEQRFISVMMGAWSSVHAYEEKFGPLIGALLAEAERMKDIMPLYAMTKDAVGADDYVPGAKMIAAIEGLYNGGVEAGVFRALPTGIVGPLAHAMVEGGMRALMSNPTSTHRRLVQTELRAVFEKAFFVERAVPKRDRP